VPQTGPEFSQKAVARQVAQAVIDEFETVHVQKEDGEKVVGIAFGPGKGTIEVFQEKDPVGKVGQGIVMGLMARVCSRFLRSVISVKDPPIRVTFPEAS